MGLFVRCRRLQLSGETVADSNCGMRIRPLTWQRVRLLNGVSKAGKESYTGLTAPHVPFQFLAQRVVQGAVQIV